MPNGTMYIDGQDFAIAGKFEIDFLTFENKLEAARNGRIFANTESKVPTISVDAIMIDPAEYTDFTQFIGNCAGRRFNVTVGLEEGCADTRGGVGYRELYFRNCLLQGSPKYSLFEKKIDGFELGYERYSDRGLPSSA